MKKQQVKIVEDEFDNIEMIDDDMIGEDDLAEEE